MTPAGRRLWSAGAVIALAIAYASFADELPLSRIDSQLIDAVKQDDVPRASALLASGADVNCRERTRYRSCTDIFPRRTRRTALILSLMPARSARTPHAGRVSPRDGTMLHLLLDHHADPNRGDAEGVTPLHLAAERGDVTSVQALLNHGAQVDAPRSDGDTPLIEAAYYGRPEVVRSLLDHKADVNARGFLGFTALARTTGYMNHLDVMDLLLSRGADVNSKTNMGETPLHDAVRYGRLDAIRLLLQYGADPNIKDEKGRAPFSMIEEYGDKALDRWQDRAQGDADKRQSEMRLLLTQSGGKA